MRIPRGKWARHSAFGVVSRLIVVLSIPALAATAQGLPGMKPLAIPNDVAFHCREVPVTSRDSFPVNSTSWEFEMGQPGFDSRDLTLSLDSGSRPLRLLEVDFEHDDGAVLHGISAWFTRQAGVIGLHYQSDRTTTALPTDSASVATRYAKTTKLLSSEEQRQASALADWLAARVGSHLCSQRRTR